MPRQCGVWVFSLSWPFALRAKTVSRERQGRSPSNCAAAFVYASGGSNLLLNVTSSAQVYRAEFDDVGGGRAQSNLQLEFKLRPGGNPPRPPKRNRQRTTKP